MRTVLATFALLGVAACDGLSGGGSSSIAADTLLAVGEGQETAPYGQVATGSVPFNIASPPVAFETLQTTPSCNRPKARPGAKAAYVYTYGGGVHVPLQHVNFKDTPAQAEARREAMKSLKNVTQKSAIASEFTAFQAGNTVEWSSRIDVLVTETSAPVFLYLSSYDPILWNIQLAPGASLDGVVVNSYDAGAIANGTDAARTALISRDNSPNTRCYVEAPIRSIPVADRIAAARKINPDFNPSQYRQQWEADYRKGQNFSSEVMRLVGKKPDWIVTRSADGNGINAILIGPMPTTPVALQPITRLQIPSHITTFWGSRRDAFKAFGLEEVV